MTATAPHRPPHLGSGRHRVRLTPPEGWEPLDQADPLVRSWAAPLDGVSPVRSTLQIAVVAAAAPSSIVELAVRHRTNLTAGLQRGRLIDHDVVELAGRDASYLVALTADPSGGCVTLEQWMLAVERWTVIITARLCSADYPALLHEIRDALETLEFGHA